jgi:hypothetical protein
MEGFNGCLLKGSIVHMYINTRRKQNKSELEAVSAIHRETKYAYFNDVALVTIN